MMITREEKQVLKEKIRRIQGDLCYLHEKYYQTVLTGSEYRKQHKKDFDLEHKNDDKNDFRIENLGLSCHSCNCRKRNERYQKNTTTQHKVLYMREREGERGSVRVEGLKGDVEAIGRMSPEMRKSERYFPIFETYIIERVTDEKQSDYEDTLHSACYKAKIKVKTGREWMKLVTSSVGPVAIVKENDEPRWVVMRDRTKSKERIA